MHPDGELASARAAAELELPLITSTASATAMEEIAEANGSGPRWYQLYWTNDDELTASLVGARERLRLQRDRGHRRQLPAWLEAAHLEQAYLPFLDGIGIAQ